MAEGRMLSIRTRFEIFKRDNFTCRYCGHKSPEVVLEVDHILPVSNGGDSDMMNLITSCFDCNRGKADKNLSEIITGDDPHDKAIELLERERQLAEYAAARRVVNDRMANDLKWLDNELDINLEDKRICFSIKNMIRRFPIENIRDALEISFDSVGDKSSDCIPYCWGILKNWDKEGR